MVRPRPPLEYVNNTNTQWQAARCDCCFAMSNPSRFAQSGAREEGRMKYTHAIPSYYNGIMMPSEGERRWAAFFDQLEWRWKYEPIPVLPGWRPDFSWVGTTSGHRVDYNEAHELEFEGRVLKNRTFLKHDIPPFALIETKRDTDTMTFHEAREKATYSNWDGMIIILGDCPCWEDEGQSNYLERWFQCYNAFDRYAARWWSIDDSEQAKRQATSRHRWSEDQICEMFPMIGTARTQLVGGGLYDWDWCFLGRCVACNNVIPFTREGEFCPLCQSFLFNNRTRTMHGLLPAMNPRCGDPTIRNLWIEAKNRNQYKGSNGYAKWQKRMPCDNTKNN